jgi:hypothetical protein
MTEQQQAKPPRLKKDGTPWAKKTEHEPTSLTERGVERIKPPKKGHIVKFDTAQRGLMFRVSYGGGKSFSVVHYPEGKPKFFKLGNFNPDGVGADDYPDVAKGATPPKDLTLAGDRVRAADPEPANPNSRMTQRELIEAFGNNRLPGLSGE